MFYTKYRPQKFSDLAQPNEVADSLATQVKTNKYAHAYLFVGPRGTGKTSLARILAKALNCLKPSKNGDPCDECENCNGIKASTFLDLIEIDAASNRGIDDIRSLKDKIRLAPTLGKVKVYIIDEVHMLTTEAFNALLKTLEEPPKNTVLILCTTEIHKVPETIKSRCQIFKFKRASISQIKSKLENIAKKEKYKISSLELETIARASHGGFRDAETYLQQIIEGDVKIDSIAGLSSHETYKDFICFLLSNDSYGAIKLINNVYDDGIDLFVWSGELLKFVRDFLLLKSGFSPSELEIDESLLEDLSKDLKKLDISFLSRLLEVVSKAQTQVKNAFIPQLPLELAILEICSDSQYNDVSKAVHDKPTEPKKTKTKPSKLETKETDVLVENQNPDEASITTDNSSEVEETGSDDTLLEKIKEGWTDLLASVNKANSSIFALLKASSPIKVEGKNLILEVLYTFHKDRLESPRNRKVVEQFIKEMHDLEIGIKCLVNGEKARKTSSFESGILTDKNVVMARADVPFDKGAMIEMLDGGLPLI